MDSTLQTLQQIATGGGPILLITILWIGYRALRAAEKAVEAFNAMRTDISEVKNSLVTSAPQREEAVKLIRNIDSEMKENGSKLDKLVARAA